LGKVDLMPATPTPPRATPRTLPTDPIPQVAYGAIIEEGWGDSVAQSLNNLNQISFLTWPADPPAGSSTPTATPTATSMSTWLEVGQLNVPDWLAADALIQTSIEAVVEGTGGPNTYDLDLSVGGITSGRISRLTAPVASGQWFTVVFSCLIPIQTLTGWQDVEILAHRVSGSGVWTATAETAVAVIPHYRDPVGWYGA
jgi:hypothetical protein